VVGQAGDQGMAVVQVEVDRLADRAQPADQLQYGREGGRDGALDGARQFGQAWVVEAQRTEVPARLRPREVVARLLDADVAGVDAEADPREVGDLFGDLGEPLRWQPRRVFHEHERPVRARPEAAVERVQAAHEFVGLRCHFCLVVDDESPDPPGEAGGELLQDVPARPVQHVDTTAEVDGRQVRVRRDEPEDLLELLGSVRVDLRGHARLREPQTGQLEHRRVTGHPLLEQCAQGRGGGGHARTPCAAVGIVKPRSGS